MVSIPKLTEIKLIREELGLNQKQLAKLCGIPTSLLNMIEKRKAKPSYDNLVKIFDVLDIKEKKLLGKLKTAEQICTKNIQSIRKNDLIEDAQKNNE